MSPKSLKDYLSLKYKATLFWDEDDGCWFVEYPDLPGCLAHGESKEKAIRAADRAKKSWIETAMEAGWSVPEPSSEIEVSGRLTFRPPKYIHHLLTQKAEHEKTSINQLITAYVAEGLERSKTKDALKSLVDHSKKEISEKIEKVSFQVDQWEKLGSNWPSHMVITTAKISVGEQKKHTYSDYH